MSAQPVNPDLPPDQVTVFIDGVELAAPKGSMIIQAADKAGIPIPRFCYHDKLAIAANCRMSLVDVEKMGKPAPACATPVMDGMKVLTRSDKALKSQRNVMEFLLINHPLDCPICDQGGECELQDLSLGYGRSVSRFSERKRVVADEDLGPLVATDMTRCIHCTRCIRVTGEIAGTYELGGMMRGENLQIGIYDGKPLTTELSGNVIDVCPVGALTNKVFRFRARPWELIAKESLGYHDALGSNLCLHARRGDVMRTVPRDNEAVNECWLSDRDRYSHQGLQAEDRAVMPMLREGDDWREVSWEEALAKAARILRDNAADDLGILVHPSTSNEEGALLARLADALGTGNIDHRIAQHDLSDGASAEAFGMPVAEIENADVILIVGSQLRFEVPRLHQRVRKAWKRGAKVHVVNPVDFDFAFDIAGKQNVAHRISQHDLSARASDQGFRMPGSESDEADVILIVCILLRFEVPLLYQRVRKAGKRGAKVHVVNPVDFDFAFDIAGKQIVAPSRIADALGSAELAQAFNGATRAAVIVGAIAENGIHASAIRKAATGFASANNAALCRTPHGPNAPRLAPPALLPRSRE